MATDADDYKDDGVVDDDEHDKDDDDDEEGDKDGDDGDDEEDSDDVKRARDMAAGSGVLVSRRLFLVSLVSWSETMKSKQAWLQWTAKAGRVPPLLGGSRVRAAAAGLCLHT